MCGISRRRSRPRAKRCTSGVRQARIAPEARAIVDENTPPEDAADIDAEWEEAPVSFSAGAAYEMGGPTGVVAKIRASNRPVNPSVNQEAAR